ncbi:Ribosomal protein S18 acetylase RimI [Actinokineospora iranica]|uniref:Ribosomal protein S18 acetylase RimI n=2 Tax=Actinokineospora iranica TaxID=1271860 RepID=A0A1G6S3Z0_9PSEU|nr:Ribosomal protein S18 acetylase RimI [Actinokineospora iranica]
MQDLTQRVWSATSPHHVGDLAWGRSHTESADWPIAMWEADGRVGAWAWANLPDDLRLQVDPAHPHLVGEALAWFDDLAEGGLREINPLDTQTDLVETLLAHGYRPRDDAPFFAYHRHDLTALPDPVLPAGFTARPVRGEADLAQRVAVHQAAWNSTRVTPESYRAVMTTWPYRADLDWVIESPDGDFAANCLIWLDPANRVGLIEPVGTAPAHRRRGLSRAVCLAALHALKAAGATQAIVYPRGDAAYPVPRVLYRGLGFRPYARTRTYAKQD